MDKKIIDKISKCYSVNAMEIQGKLHLIYAGEGDGSLCIYSGEKFEDKQVLWDESAQLGGTMTISTVDDKEGYFFVSTGFFTMIQSETSSIYLVRYQNGEFTKVKVCDIPYLHRFDVLTIEGHRYLVACTIHSGKKDMPDWSKPGKVFVAELPYDLDSDVAVELQLLKEGLTMNHGFNRFNDNGVQGEVIAAKDGVFKVIPPQQGNKEWIMEQVFDFPASDVCAFDLDGDGELEYGIMSPFHGDDFSIYKKVGNEAVRIYQHEKKLDFYHAIFAGKYNGQPCFVIGARKEDMDLYRVFYNEQTKAMEPEVIEVGAGSSNARIIQVKDKSMIMSANRQKDEAAIYF